MCTFISRYLKYYILLFFSFFFNLKIQLLKLTTLSKTGELSLVSWMVTLNVQASSSWGCPLSVARTVRYTCFSLAGSSRSNTCNKIHRQEVIMKLDLPVCPLAWIVGYYDFDASSNLGAGREFLRFSLGFFCFLNFIIPTFFISQTPNLTPLYHSTSSNHYSLEWTCCPSYFTYNLLILTLYV